MYPMTNGNVLYTQLLTFPTSNIERLLSSVFTDTFSVNTTDIKQLLDIS